MDVLEHDQQRPRRRRPAEQLQRELVQPALPEAAGDAPPALFGPQPRQQRRERAARVVVERPVVERQLAQRRDHRRVRELLAAELEALAVQHQEPGLAAAGLELADQPRLADPGLAGDQRELRRTRRGVLEQARERAQRLVAADDRPARDLAAVHRCE